MLNNVYETNYVSLTGWTEHSNSMVSVYCGTQKKSEAFQGLKNIHYSLHYIRQPLEQTSVKTRQLELHLYRAFQAMLRLAFYNSGYPFLVKDKK